MIAVDTNVLVRFLVRDSVTPEHSDAAAAEFRRAREAGDRVFVPIVALIETIWVLSSRMKVPKEDVLDMLTALLAESFITVDRPALCCERRRAGELDRPAAPTTSPTTRARRNR